MIGRHLLTLALSGLLALAPPAYAQDAPRAGVAEVAPITFGSLINGTSGGVIVGPEDQVRERVLAVLAQHDLPAVSPAAVQGSRIDASNARFILNGTVTEQACHSETNWSGCRWRILWSVVDQQRREVVLEVTGVGEASVPQMHPSTAMYIELIARAALPLARSPRVRTVLAAAGDPTLAEEGWSRDVGARPCPAETRSLPADTRTLQPALFTVQTDKGRADGVIFTPDGLGVTAATPLADLRVMSATRADGRALGVTVLRVDPDADLALVALTDTDGACVALRGAAPILDEPVFALGTRREAGWGLRTGVVTATPRYPTGPHLDTDAALSELSPRAPLFDAGGAWMASAPPAGTAALLASGTLDRLGVVPSESPDSLIGIDRLAQASSEPVRLELGGAVDAPLQAPIGPGQRMPTLADAPGGPELAGGAAMVGLGAVVGVPVGMVWGLRESRFEVSGGDRLGYAVVSGLSVGLAIGGGVLIYRGLKKAEASDDPGARIVLSPTGVGLSGRF